MPCPSGLLVLFFFGDLRREIVCVAPVAADGDDAGRTGSDDEGDKGEGGHAFMPFKYLGNSVSDGSLSLHGCMVCMVFPSGIEKLCFA